MSGGRAAAPPGAPGPSAVRSADADKCPAAAGLDRTALTQTLEATMDEHRPVRRHWWSKYYRCACGLWLDRCTTYWAQMARGR